MVMRRLPSLAGLEAFIAVARHGSIKGGAAELALSMPALSRRIQALERHLGDALFDRDHHAMRLTTSGERLLAALNPALDALRDAVTSAVGEADELRLRLNVRPLFAQQRLFPRLPELRAAHPHLHIDIDTSSHAEARLGEDHDAAIVLAQDTDPSLHAVRLDRDKILPIAARRFGEGAEKITVPEQLQRMTVLLHRDMPDTFRAWRRAIGMEWLEPHAIDYFDSGPLMLEAAAQGVGIAFMHGHHLADARDARLIHLFDFHVESRYSYWFVCRPRALKRPAVKIFHDWLAKAAI